MIPFRFLLLVLFLVITGYTVVVVTHHGWNLLPAFVSAIMEQTWQGQFNLDFLCYLLLSAIWIVWRHKFSSVGFALGGLALVGGMLSFAPYLLIISLQARGDINRILAGTRERTLFTMA